MHDQLYTAFVFPLLLLIGQALVALGTVPSDYRPSAAVMAPVLKASGQAYGGSYLQVTSDGTVTLLNAGNSQAAVDCYGTLSWVYTG